MPIMAAYDENQRTGLSLAIHDPWGSTKDLLVESQTKGATLRMAVDHPVPDMGKPGNGFELSGKAEWRLLRGDWFDAAVAYRQWVRKEAKWYPKLTGKAAPIRRPGCASLRSGHTAAARRAVCARSAGLYAIPWSARSRALVQLA